MVEDTAARLEEAVVTAGETVQITKDTADQIPKATPKTTKAVKKGAKTV